MEYEPTILFFGSSYTARQVVPHVVHSITGQNAYNLGLGGAGGDEIEHIVELYFKNCDKTPEIVVIEARAKEFRLFPKKNPRYFWFKGPIYWTNIGQAYLYGSDWGGREVPQAHYFGWVPMTFDYKEWAATQGAVLSSLGSNLSAKMWQVRDGTLPDPEVPPDVKVVFLYTPTGARAPQEGEAEVIIDFNRPDLYPSLFREADRADPTHLNPRGAKLFSEMLADRLSEFLPTQ